jgi:ArsR family transcriptional regulator, zinc-responsive transcriptional repressor
MKCPSFNRFFETISTPLRLKIIYLLKNKTLSVGEICDSLKEEQSKISHNLKALSECHLLDVKQKGKQRLYSLNEETMLPLLELVEKHVEKYCSSDCKLKMKK